MACWCNDGWVCEDHPDQPVSHQVPKDQRACGGAGMPCTNPKCKYGRHILAGGTPRPFGPDELTFASTRKKPRLH